MKMFRSRTAASFAALAVVAMTATPVLARGYDDWGRHRHHRGGGIDGGSLLAGLLVGGAAVAIATSASKKSSDTHDEPAPYRYPGGPVAGSEAGDQGYADERAGTDYGSRDYQGEPGAGQGSFDSAVDACSAELERGDKRVDSVENVRRMGERYSVEGRLQGGAPYACSVDDTGHIRSVAVDGHAMI
jgi:hypothetical protein